jgi:hypothetical protein
MKLPCKKSCSLNYLREVAVALLVIISSNCRADQVPQFTIDKIQVAWQARQEQTKSARFFWKEQKTWPKGAISSAFASIIQQRNPGLKSKVMPSADRSVNFTYILTLHENKVRFESSGEEWDPEKQDFRPVKYVSVFDGKTAKYLYPDGIAHATWPLGTIRADPNYRDAELAALRPLLLVYRPFVETLQPVDIQGFSLENDDVVIDGLHCIELVRRFSTNSSIHFWLDRDRDFLLIRRLIVEQGKPFESIDIRYQIKEGIGFVPFEWRVVSNSGKGQLLCSGQGTLTSISINMSVEESSFDIDFPPGARVEDERKKEDYILRQDGSKRPILPQDFGATYEQILNSTPGNALKNTQSQQHWWTIAIAGTLGLLALFVFIWRRRLLRGTLKGK